MLLDLFIANTVDGADALVQAALYTHFHASIRHCFVFHAQNIIQLVNFLCVALDVNLHRPIEVANEQLPLFHIPQTVHTHFVHPS